MHLGIVGTYLLKLNYKYTVETFIYFDDSPHLKTIKVVMSFIVD